MTSKIEIQKFLAISEFPKGRKYLISLSFRGKASVRPAQVGGFDVNIVIHGSTAVRGRGDLVAYRWALWKLTAPWTHRTRPPHLGKRCAFSTSSTGPFPSNHSRKTPKGPKIALGNPDRPKFLAISEFPKWRKYLISLCFRGKSSVRPVQVGGFDVNIVTHRRGGPVRYHAWPPPWEPSCRTRTGPVELVENAQRFPRCGGRVLCVHGAVSFHRAHLYATRSPRPRTAVDP